MTLPVDWKSFNLCQNLSGPQIILKVATTGFVSLNLYFDKIDEYIKSSSGIKKYGSEEIKLYFLLFVSKV